MGAVVALIAALALTGVAQADDAGQTIQPHNAWLDSEKP